MTLQSDCSIGIKKETTYGTAVVVDRFPEFTEQSLVQNNEYVQGEGMRVGKVLPRFNRRALGKVVAEGDIDLELCTRGLGPIFEAMLGQAASTLRAAGIYQQVFQHATTDPMPSYTLQAGVPPVGGGATAAHTFPGSVCDSWELSVEAGGIATLSTSWVSRELLTASAYASPAYASAAKLFTFQQGAFKLGVNGTDALTLPTSTVLGDSAAVATANITSFSLKGENAVDDGGYVFGSAGKRGRRPVYGMRSLSGSITAEFTATALRDLYLAQSSLHAVLTLTSDDLISGSTYAALQVVLPALVFEGDVPTSNGGDVITTDIDFTVLDDGTSNPPMLLSVVTADSAI